MDAHHPSGLRASFADRALHADATTGSEVVGLSGVLAARGHRARRRRVPGTAVSGGFRWRLVDVWNTTWWPQGVAVGEHGGVPVALASWFAQPRRGREMGSRITVVDLGDPRRPRYHHVLLVAPRRRDGAVSLEPVKVHAGGIAWSGDRLLVAATYGGILEFRLSDIVRTPSRGLLRRAGGPFGYRHLLPQFGTFGPEGEGRRSKQDLRYSFIASEGGAVGGVAPSGDDATALRLVSGEYGTSDEHRVTRLRMAGDHTVVDEVHVPRIPRMQGAVLHDGAWYVTASRGDKQGGDLWAGTPGSMTRLEGALPAGPEDIAVWPERGQLWSVSEFPGKRWMYWIDIAAVAPSA
jgi:hypothetical protein